MWKALWLQVWRILFWAMAGLAIGTCVMTGTVVVDPRRYLPKKDTTLLPGRFPEAGCLCAKWLVMCPTLYSRTCCYRAERKAMFSPLRLWQHGSLLAVLP